MKLLIKIFFLFGLALCAANAGEQIKAIKVPGNVDKIGPLSRAWISSEYTDVVLYPRKTTFEQINQNTKVKKARVKALYNDTNIAFLIEWEDKTKDIKKECCAKTQGDGFALQFPKEYKDALKLPYIVMGNKDRSVIVHLKTATEKTSKDESNIYFQSLQEYYDTFHTSTQVNEDIDDGRLFIMEGLNLISEIKDTNNSSTMEIVYKEGIWRGTLSRALRTEYLDLRDGSFPVSFITWDGNLDEAEYFSSWVGVKLVGQREGYELLDTLNAPVDGDISNGKRLAMENCAACHNFRDSSAAQANMAPELSNIGGYATTQYIRESIIDPSAVVVPNHTAKKEESFPWHVLDENGNLISTMPSYNWMDEKSINDLVAFFSSLKIESEK